MEVEQRPYPLPSSPWIMTQTWSNMLFAHWPISTNHLRAHIPSILDIDARDGTSWISIIPFQVRHTRLHSMPKFPFYHTYLELNVRTYVMYKGVPGVYFFSLDANKWPVVTGAKIGAALPYKHACMKMTVKDPIVHVKSQRQHPGSPSESFKASYQQSSSIYIPDKESLEYWLLERYCFWTLKGNTLYRGDIHHDRWRITNAKADLYFNTMASFLPQYSFQNEPLLHFSSNKNVFTWPLKKVR